MVKLTTSYEGGLRCRATHGPSGTTLVTDAPVDNHGKGESFSRPIWWPRRLVPA